ncbi:MAG: hypothetical protein JW904_05255 [Spirochaetales bacterium]|nr:hypothetical protein [Spirochaetales bacterium]
MLYKISNTANDYVNRKNEEKTIYSVVLPCIVLDAPLFISWFDEKNNKFISQPAQYGRLLWNGCRNGIMIDIVHIDATDEYAKILKSGMDSIYKVMERMIG